MDGRRRVGNKSTEVVALMDTSSSLLKEHWGLRQKVTFTNKTRQNTVHQHTLAAIRGAILDNQM